MRFLALLASLPAALAGCPNQCSGRGTCAASDQCTCFNGFVGADCSLRTCRSGPAWSANNANPHAYSECSNQGVCNRVAGACECFAGFEGNACSIMSCPNACSGNGVCKALLDLNTTVAYDPMSWDAKRILGCACDAGYFGNDCSSMHCPTGDDPLTLCLASTAITGQTQEVRFTLGSAVAHNLATTNNFVYTSTTETADLFGTSSTSQFNTIRATTGQMHVSYVTAWGGVFTGRAVSGILSNSGPTSRDSLEAALETLPANVVHDVVVTTELTPAAVAMNVIERRFLVTFTADYTDSANVGMQQPLLVDTAYSCVVAGCAPMVSMPFLYRYGAIAAEAAVGSSGASALTNFFNGNLNVDATFMTAPGALAVKFLRLSAASQPQMPLGTAVDRGVSALLPARWDIRVLVAVVDPTGDASDTAVDMYYTRVIYGNGNINADSERVGFASGTTGVWGTTSGVAKVFTTTLDGFTFQGPIPAAFSSVPIAGAPGVLLAFPAQNIVTTDSYGRWFEILVKLPHTTVTPVTVANQMLNTAAVTGYAAPVDPNVENIECSARGTCNRASGACGCYTGYAGVACQIQTALV